MQDRSERSQSQEYSKVLDVLKACFGVVKRVGEELS